MPHSTPKADMASDTSMPPATRRWGMSTELALAIRLPSRAVKPTGTAMAAMRPQATGGPSGAGRGPICRRNRIARATAENTSQRTMPITISPTVRSGF